MDCKSLQAAYQAGKSPADIASEVHAACSACPETFLALPTLPSLLDACSAALAVLPAKRTAIWGTFFAVKDNVDVAGLPTTAACAAFSRVPPATAPAVQALLDAGAICVGKVNMDQFAAGLVGTRTPHGVPRNTLDSRIIPGGSSSGSGAAVAAGLVTFAVGTDTAGSGRVPAGLQGIVGIKPSVGMISTRGVVPACASLDCLSVFAANVSDGVLAATVMAGGAKFPEDATLRFQARHEPPAWLHAAPAPAAAPAAHGFTFAVPPREQLAFAGPRGAAYEAACHDAFAAAAERLRRLGGVRVEMDFEPLCATARMLYETSFVAERYAGIAEFLESSGDGEARKRGAHGLVDVSADGRLEPVTRAIISAAGQFSAVDAFRDLATLRDRRAAALALMAEHAADVLLVPTVMHHYLVSEVTEEEGATPPAWSRNAHLGTFTNFVNLLDLCAVSVPAGALPPVALEGSDEALKLAFGVTIIGHGRKDEDVWALAHRFEAS